jgi:hypothetical protein
VGIREREADRDLPDLPDANPNHAPRDRHVVLGHTAEGIEQDGPRTPRNIREVEAEGVAFICSSALGLDGAEYSRGYLQHWLNGQEIPERSCQRIFKGADAILKAGRQEQVGGGE